MLDYDIYRRPWVQSLPRKRRGRRRKRESEQAQYYQATNHNGPSTSHAVRANVSGGEEERCGTKETHKRWEEEGRSPCIWEINKRRTLGKQFSQENKQVTTAVTEAASPQAGAVYKQIQSNYQTSTPQIFCF